MILGQIVAFGVFSAIAIGGALGMATTMSMFRSGIFLMASFIGVAGLFILLSADLLSLLQVMMYIGGMLVMILFMVLFSHDPGGEMMASMEMSPVEKFFSLGLGSGQAEHDEHSDATEHQDEQEGERTGNESSDMHPSHEHGNMHHGMDMSNMSHDDMHHSDGHDHLDMGNEDEGSDMHHSDGYDGMQGGMDMDDMDMSMVTPIRPLATVIAALIGALLVALLLLRPAAWQISSTVPNPRSAIMVGSLLMGKYMMAFEGAGLLILTGIFGAVMISRPGQHPSEKSREARVEVDAPPAPIADDSIRVN